jgi:hypothetical protein
VCLGILLESPLYEILRMVCVWGVDTLMRIKNQGMNAKRGDHVGKTQDDTFMCAESRSKG